MAANVGYCGIDKGRLPLRGDEIRACWEEAPVHARSDAAGVELPTIDPAPAFADGDVSLWADAEG